MKITAMLSFYDERKDWLVSSVRDLYSLGVTELVVVDGAYELLPDGCSRSSEYQVAAIRGVARDLGMGLTLYQPSKVWDGNEVQKRQVMLDLALAVSGPDDWLAIWDADYKLVSGPASEVYPALLWIRRDFAEVSFSEDPGQSEASWHGMRMFMRAQPGIKMAGNHHTYELADGRTSQVLSRPELTSADATAIDLRDVRIYHRVAERDADRRARQTRYYEQRDGLDIEG